MKHRGTDRKRILVVKADAALPHSGEVKDGGTVLGELLSVYGAKGFALVRLDRIQEAKGQLTVEQIPVALTRPDWLN
jgi:folate-binding Fe-S cluster repair protein YgfZ